MFIDRSWMWHRFDDNGYIISEFDQGLKEFLDFAYSHQNLVSHGKIRCPCSKCRSRKFDVRESVRHHIKRNGFKNGYNTWDAHGETCRPHDTQEPCRSTSDEYSGMRTMVMDAIGPNFRWDFDNDENPRDREQSPNSNAHKFFDLLKDANEPLLEGCKRQTRLSAVSQLLNIKSEFNLSHACFDRIMSSIKSMMPSDEKLPSNLYNAKKMSAKLGLGYEKIDVCINNCMLYFKENNNRSSAYIMVMIDTCLKVLVPKKINLIRYCATCHSSPGYRDFICQRLQLKR